jgi:hypothetical protein
MPNHIEMVGEIGLPIHQNTITQLWAEKGKVLPIPVCPKCKSANYILCPDCKCLINELKTSDDDSTLRKFECPNCKKEYPRYIVTKNSSMRRAFYVFGYQETVEDITDIIGRPKNVKHMLFVDENGIFTIEDHT